MDIDTYGNASKALVCRISEVRVGVLFDATKRKYPIGTRFTDRDGRYEYRYNSHIKKPQKMASLHLIRHQKTYAGQAEGGYHPRSRRP